MNESARSFRLATWLGWQIESNWADPFLFSIYAIVRPVSSALILVVMYSVVAGAGPDNPLFSYIYLGNAFYILVGSVLVGISWAILMDREEYGMLKYICVAPVHLLSYLIGRGTARLFIGLISVFVTLLVGVLFLQLPINLAMIDWPMFLVALVIGVCSLMAMGLLLAGVSFLTAHHHDFIGDAVAGALYLFTGAIFPISVLPAVLQPIGLTLPITYWLELLRRAILAESVASTFATWSDANVLVGLLVSTIVWGIISVSVFFWAERRARNLGLFDWETQY